MGYTWSENYHPGDELCQAPPSPGGTTASKQKEALGGVRISISLSGIQKCPLSARRVDHIHHRPTYLSLTKRMTYGCSAAQSCPILWPHSLQHTRLPCPSRSPRACSNSCPLSQWCHPTISSSAAPFFSCPQSSPASGTFLMSWLFT